MVQRPKALVLAPMRGPGFDLLGKVCDVVYDPWIEQEPIRLYDEHKLAGRIADEGASVLVCEADRVAGPVLDAALRVVASTRGDPTNVDVAAATAKGIPVLNAPGRNADAVAEMTVALLFAAARHVLPADRDTRTGQTYRDGRIPYQRFRSWQLAGRTAGIVGLGAIGRSLRWRLEGLGMRVIAHDPYAEDATYALADLLAEADVVSLHAPVTPGTSGMIGAEQFASMKRGAIFLNLARAALHDTDALVDAIDRGHLGGAGLDHFEGEFLAPDHPLATYDNVVLTPHIGGATYDVEANQAEMIAADIERLLRGERPLHCVNPEVLR